MPTVLITHDKELLTCSRHNIMVTWPNLGTASSLPGLFDLALGILALLGIFKIRTMTGQNLNKIKWDFVLPLNLKEYKLFYVIIMGLVLNFVVLSQTSKKGHFLVTLCLYFKTSPYKCKTFHLKMSVIYMKMNWGISRNFQKSQLTAETLFNISVPIPFPVKREKQNNCHICHKQSPRMLSHPECRMLY